MAVSFDKFVTMLTRCEMVKGNVLTNWEQQFIVDLRAKFDGREDQADLGLTMWQPTVSQYNTLHGIWSKL